MSNNDLNDDEEEFDEKDSLEEEEILNEINDSD